MEHVLINTTLAQSSLLPFKSDFVLYRIGAVVLLVPGINELGMGQSKTHRPLTKGNEDEQIKMSSLRC
jgi:hypothetical protein